MMLLVVALCRLLRLTSSYGWRFNQYIGIPANLAFALIAILAWKRPDCVIQPAPFIRLCHTVVIP